MRSRGVLAVLTVLTFALPAAPAGAQLAGRIIAIAVAGPLTGGAAPFGVEQKQAVELAVDEQNATGGILGAKVALVSGDDRADAGEAKVLAQQFCEDARVLGVVGHVNSGVSVEASTVYKGCGLGMLTAMSSSPSVTALPKDFDVLFFAGIAEAAPLLRELRATGRRQIFACGDGCWDAKGFIARAEGATTQGEGVLVLSAAPAVGRVPGSAEFAARYKARYGPIANYAVNAYDAARLILRAVETAARRKGGLPARGEVPAALRAATFQGIAYSRPVAWDAKGDNTAAVIFLNVVEGDHFKEIAEVSPEDPAK